MVPVCWGCLQFLVAADDLHCSLPGSWHEILCWVHGMRLHTSLCNIKVCSLKPRSTSGDKMRHDGVFEGGVRGGGGKCTFSVCSALLFTTGFT
jgi:hypothetical protein